MSKAAIFTIRVRDNKGMKRVLFPSENEQVYSYLQSEIHALCGIPPSEQVISTTPPPQNTILRAPPTATMKDLNLKHGDIIYLCNTSEVDAVKMSLNPSAPPINSVKPVELTKYCQHGPTGRCSHCMPLEPGATPKVGTCNHPSSQTCLNCSNRVNDKTMVTKVAKWLCNHPSSAVCPKCAPQSPQTENNTPKVDYIPFSKQLSDLAALCKYRHSDQTKCVMCLPPPQPIYTGRNDCDNHRPYPQGSCNKCMPTNAVLRPQNYRYIDSVSLPDTAIEDLYRSWTLENKREVQRCWMMYGKVVDEEENGEFTGGKRALVAAFFEPMQVCEKEKVDLKNSEDMVKFETMMDFLQLEPVGWLVMSNTKPYDEKLYGGKVIMNATEVITAAKLQHAYRKGLDNKKDIAINEGRGVFTYSNMVTVVIEHDTEIEPKAYMISDQGVALVRDGSLTVSPTDPNLLATAVPTNKPVASIIYHDRPLKPGQSFLPDNLLVKVRSFTSNIESQLFTHYSYPPIKKSDDITIQTYLDVHKKENWITRCSDANLLMALQSYLKSDMFDRLLEYIAERSMDDDFENELTLTFNDLKLCELD